MTHKDNPADIRIWSDLEEVNIPPIDHSIGLLIGINALRALEPWRIIKSVGSGPYAVKTLLGWVINGPLGSDENLSETCANNRVKSIASLKNLWIKLIKLIEYNQVPEDSV